MFLIGMTNHFTRRSPISVAGYLRLYHYVSFEMHVIVHVHVVYLDLFGFSSVDEVTHLDTVLEAGLGWEVS